MNQLNQGYTFPISIITVAYNSARTIERTIQSVLDQNYSNLEYIIIDGLSKDATIDIVKKYEPLFHGNMKWVSEPDSGIYNAMNKGIKMVSGDILGIVNSDDWLEKNALHKVEELFRNSNDPQNTIVCGDILFHYCNGNSQRRYVSEKRLRKYAKIYDIGIFHPATFVSSSIYENIGLFDENFKLNADVDFILRCYRSKAQFVCKNVVLSNMSDGGATNSGMSQKEVIDRKMVIMKHCQNRLDYLRVWIPYRIKHFFRIILPHKVILISRSILDKQA